MSKWVVKKFQRYTFKFIKAISFNTFQEALEYWQKAKGKKTVFYTYPDEEDS